jgi:hypothetical protein
MDQGSLRWLENVSLSATGRWCMRTRIGRSVRRTSSRRSLATTAALSELFSSVVVRWDVEEELGGAEERNVFPIIEWRKARNWDLCNRQIFVRMAEGVIAGPQGPVLHSSLLFLLPPPSPLSSHKRTYIEQWQTAGRMASSSKYVSSPAQVAVIDLEPRLSTLLSSSSS